MGKNQNWKTNRGGLNIWPSRFCCLNNCQNNNSHFQKMSSKWKIFAISNFPGCFAPFAQKVIHNWGQLIHSLWITFCLWTTLWITSRSPKFQKSNQNRNTPGIHSKNKSSRSYPHFLWITLWITHNCTGWTVDNPVDNRNCTGRYI